MRTRLSLLALTLCFAGCDGGEIDGPLRPDTGMSLPDAGPGGGDTTYHGDLRPILAENCVTCHTEGGVAPFPLETYAQVSEVGERMREVTRDRIMPPFLADNSGECNTWSNHRGLTDEEIAVFDQWVVDGKLEGDPSTPEPPRAELPTLPSVDLTLETPSYAIDEAGDDDYRCFVVETGLTEDQYVTGYDVHPGNAQRVHHVIVYNPVDAGAVAAAEELDMRDGVAGDGYPCFGGPRVDAPPMVLWAPGAGATAYPRGTGVLVEAGIKQIIQVHYNNLVEEAPNEDRTTIDLSLRASANRAFIAPLWDTSLNLPPRMEEVVESNTINLSALGLPVDVRVWGAFPHMHTLGRSLSVEIHRDGGGDQCLIDVPRWDFNWQLAYWLDEPITISPDDSATITCTYSTMERDEVTTWGDGTQDEMCLNFVYVTL